MSLNFLLADTLSRIRVASQAKQKFVKVKNSKFIRNVLDLLFKLGFIKAYQYSFESTHDLIVFLKYDDKDFAVIKELKLISSPGNKVYFTKKFLERNYKYKRIEYIILSTTRGLLTNYEALYYGIGGLALFIITT